MQPPRPQDFINQPIITVEAELNRMGMQFRIEREDDSTYRLTADHIPHRFNLSVDHGIVTKVRMG